MIHIVWCNNNEDLGYILFVWTNRANIQQLNKLMHRSLTAQGRFHTLVRGSSNSWWISWLYTEINSVVSSSSFNIFFPVTHLKLWYCKVASILFSCSGSKLRWRLLCSSYCVCVCERLCLPDWIEWNRTGLCVEKLCTFVPFIGSQTFLWAATTSGWITVPLVMPLYCTQDSSHAEAWVSLCSLISGRLTGSNTTMFLLCLCLENINKQTYTVLQRADNQVTSAAGYTSRCAALFLMPACHFQQIEEWF